MKHIHLSISLLILILLCTSSLHSKETAKSHPLPAGQAAGLSAFEKQLTDMGFTDVQDIDPTIKVDLKYACAKNFMGVNVYGGLTKAYLRREAAEKLAKANQHLRELHVDLTLLVVDALRPRHVQKKMRKLLEGTPMRNYVADPRSGSMHNYGCAV